MSMPTCPKCGSLAVGEKCGTCGTALSHAPATIAMSSVAVPGLELDPGPSGSGTAPGLEPTRARQASAYLNLQPSEEAVLHAASRIFAAFIASGAVTPENQNELADRSVKAATRMALVIEKYIQSDNEDW
jgi:hypothetical protein